MFGGVERGGTRDEARRVGHGVRDLSGLVGVEIGDELNPCGLQTAAHLLLDLAERGTERNATGRVPGIGIGLQIEQGA